MPFAFVHLDGRTRALMLEEVAYDRAANMLYLSENLSASGAIAYPELLCAATESGDETVLANELRVCLNTHENPRRLKSGRYSKPPVMRSNAHEMLAEGEFNRFYMRAVCRRAIEDGVDEVVVYRAKPVASARSASEQMIGERKPAADLLRDLRTNAGVDTCLGLPPGPNSGLSVRLP